MNYEEGSFDSGRFFTMFFVHWIPFPLNLGLGTLMYNKGFAKRHRVFNLFEVVPNLLLVCSMEVLLSSEPCDDYHPWHFSALSLYIMCTYDDVSRLLCCCVYMYMDSVINQFIDESKELRVDVRDSLLSM